MTRFQRGYKENDQRKRQVWAQQTSDWAKDGYDKETLSKEKKDGFGTR